MKRLFILVIVAFFLISGCKSGVKVIDLPRGEASPEWIAAAESFRQDALSIEAPDVVVPYSIMVVDHGKVVLELWYEGYSADSLFDVYSVSKTVLALAVGCAVDEGLFSVEDRVIDYFPDKLPDTISDTLSAMKIRHLLTMTCGMEETPELLSVFSGNDNFDWIEEFFNSKQAAIPGTSFYYNFFASYIVAAIIEKTAGMGVLDYIKPRLLDPLHITDMKWDDSPAGICVGGWGMFVCTEDMAKIGQLLVQRGKWNGCQLVSSEWIDTMTSNLVASKSLNAFTNREDLKMMEDQKNDYFQGYGYYVWQCKSGIYRAEGLDGKCIIINPSKETVFAITSHSNMDQRYLDLIWKHFGDLIY